MTTSHNSLCIGWKIKLLNGWLDCMHRVVRLFYKQHSVKQPDFSRILLCNWASLGDLLLATSIVPLLKAHFPHCQIGFLVSKNSKKVLDTCEGIDWIHEVESLPMALCRPHLTPLGKLCVFVRYSLRNHRMIAKEIAKKEYTCALELYPFFPTTIPILWHAKIPFRIGFDTGGSSHLLDQTAIWEEGRYLTVQYAHLLKVLGIDIPPPLRPQLSLPLYPPALSTPYLLFHPCSSESSKEFSVAFWQELYLLCQQAKLTVYFTGHGTREQEYIRQIGVEEKKNLCGKTTWSQLVSYTHHCLGVVSVDSVPVHLAAALNIPFIALYKKYSPLWHPETTQGTAFGKEGSITVTLVFDQIQRWYGKHS